MKLHSATKHSKLLELLCCYVRKIGKRAASADSNEIYVYDEIQLYYSLSILLNQSRCIIIILSFVDKLVHFGEGEKMAKSNGGKFHFLALPSGERATDEEKNEA